MITASMLAPGDVPTITANYIVGLDGPEVARVNKLLVTAWHRIPYPNHRPIGRHRKYSHRNLRGVYLTRMRSDSPQSYLQQVVDVLPDKSESQPGLATAERC